jgi:glycosyltransferase involved in cell wall biosynthesis
MKVLCVHNFYGSEAPSGENIAYETEVALLRKYGCQVVEYTTRSDSLRRRPFLGPIIGAFSCLWNPFALRRLRRLLLAERPDIMHVHNVFPRLSPGILAASAGTNTAAVLTLHNYRVACAGGTATRNGGPCQICIDQVSVLPALRNRCYRGSALATIPVAGMIAAHRWLGTLAKNVDAFVALTEFQRTLLSGPGLLPRDRVYIRPNFMPGNHLRLPLEARGDYVAFVGRLSRDKGPSLLLKAWRLWGARAPRLVFVGDGEEQVSLRELSRSLGMQERIEFLGRMPTDATLHIIQHARLIVVPSVGLEGFPMVIREAFAYGVPVIASDAGALPQIVKESGGGEVFATGNEYALARTLVDLWGDEERLVRMSGAAAAAFESLYSETAAYSRVIDIYAAAMARRRGSRRMHGLAQDFQHE